MPKSYIIAYEHEFYPHTYQFQIGGGGSGGSGTGFDGGFGAAGGFQKS